MNLSLSLRRFFLAIALALAFQACGPRPSESSIQEPPRPAAKIPSQAVEGIFSSHKELRIDSASLPQFLEKYPLFRVYRDDLQQFYQNRQWACAWFDQNGTVEQADNLFNQLLNLHQEGLPEKTLYPDSLARLFQTADSAVRPEAELMLSAQYFWYASLAWGGMPEKKSRELEWFIPRKKLDLPTLLDSLMADSSFLVRGYAFRQYGLLKNFLKKYRFLSQRPEWKESLEGMQSLHSGDSSSKIVELRKRLQDLGDLSEDSGSPRMDEFLENGIRHFQRRMGLTPDGQLGKTTLKKLNQTPEAISRQILANLERFRWVPATLSEDYLIVNIPDFQLYAFGSDTLEYTMKVVVGKAVHKTVIFNGDLQFVVFSPYWNVPPDILKKEVLPALKTDPGYLSRNQMEWNGNTVRQKPGPKNSLGLVKFLFPNQYNIYLHDTPSKSLFEREQRAFSHGCIRLAEPRKMALWLLRRDSSWTPKRVDQAMQAGKEQYVTLKKQVPVYIAYLTAWVDRNGDLQIRDDIYGRDAPLVSTLLK